DATLQADGGIAGIHAAPDAVGGEHAVEPGKDLLARHLPAIDRHRFAPDEAQRDLQRFIRPGAARRAPAAGALARRFPAVDLAAGHGDAQQVLVDGVGLLLRLHAEAALFQIGLLVGAGLRVFLLDLADRRHDPVVARRL